MSRWRRIWRNAGRCLGSMFQHCLRSSENPRGAVDGTGRCSDLLATPKMMAPCSTPRYGTSPVRSSQSTTPYDHTSTVLPYGSFRISSGAIHGGDPHTVFSDKEREPTLRDVPKSEIRRVRPSVASRMLGDLRSRWISFLSCRYSIAAAICRAHSQICVGGIRVCLITSYRFLGQNSITMAWTGAELHTPRKRTMFGCDNRDSVRASHSTASTSRNFFTATFSSLYIPRKTQPDAPLPRNLISSISSNLMS
mmetsp:Transcript_34354/g.90059  ORF Transcript_34354/g.90059 Transcript_34354/m.90059 type:complete len:251 (+) Transcript_34354:889-1641(+)